jgi:hypothetical protein
VVSTEKLALSVPQLSAEKLSIAVADPLSTELLSSKFPDAWLWLPIINNAPNIAAAKSILVFISPPMKSSVPSMGVKKHKT